MSPSVAEIIIRSRFEGQENFPRLVQDLKRLGSAQDSATQTALRQQRSSERLAQSQIAVARAARDYGSAISIVEREMASAAGDEARYNRLLAQRITLQNQAATAARRASGEQMALPRTFAGFTKDGISQIAGLSAAYVGLGTVASRVAEGFTLNATLESQRKTINTLVGDVAKGGAAMQAASDFARRYGFTQREAGEAASAAATLIRTSTTALDKQFEVLGRLASLNASEGISGATFAVKELASGDIASIVERFNLGRDAARAMKDEIASGKDVFQVLDATLTRMGVSVDVLSNRMTGATGALNRGKQASEDLSIALGNVANSSGAVWVLERLADAGQGLAQLLNGGLATGADAFHQNLIRGAATYAEYTTGIKSTTAALYQSGEAVAARQFAMGKLTEAEFIAAKASTDLAAAQANAAAHGREHAAATAALAGGTEGLVSAMQQAAQQTALATAEAQLAAQGQERLATNAQAAARELYASGNASATAMAQMAAQHGVTADLVDVYYRLEAAARAASIAQAAASAYAQNIYDDAGNVIPGRGSRKPPTVSRVPPPPPPAPRVSTPPRLTAPRSSAITSGQSAAEAVSGRIAQQAEREADARARAAEALEQSRDLLRSDAEKLANRQAQLAATPLANETARNTLTAEILDLEERISAEKARQVELIRDAQRAQVDAALARLDDSKADRAAAEKRAQAERVLASSFSTDRQRAEAQDVIARLKVENQQREMEIAELERTAGSAAPSGATFQGGPATIPQLQNGALPVVLQNPAATMPAAVMPATAASTGSNLSEDGLLGALERGLSQMQLVVEVGGVMTPAVLKIAAARAQVSKR